MKKITFKLTNKKQIKFKLITKTFFSEKKNPYSRIFSEQFANNLTNKLLDSSNNKKSFDRWVCLTVPAKGATLQPPVGPFLGQHGFNTMNFCNTFNTITKSFPESLPIKVIIKLYSDKSYQFQFKTPPSSFLLYSSFLNNASKGVYIWDLLKISFIKKIDNYNLSLLSHLSCIIGTARSMKFKILK